MRTPRRSRRATAWPRSRSSIPSRRRREADAAADRQQNIARMLALVSPAAQFTAAATNLAGAGDRVAQRWDQATLDYQTTLDRLVFDDRPRLNLLVPRATSGINSA